MDAQTTRIAIHELVQLDILAKAIYDDKTTVYRGKRWPQRIAIMIEQGWQDY